MQKLRDVANFLGETSEHQMATKLKVSAPISTLALFKAYEKLPPRAAFKKDKTDGTPPLTVRFTDESTGYILKREWKFGDGKTDDAVNPSHTYTAADCESQYPITLTVSNNGGNDTAESSLWVYPNPPKVKFSASSWGGLSPLQVTFFDETDGDCITARKWGFGDGSTGTGTNPTHVFHNNTGSAVQYSVTLTVSAQSNNPVWWTGTIIVQPASGPPPPPPPPPPSITAERDSLSEGIIVKGSHFTNGVRVRLDVTYPPGHTASYYSDLVVAGAFTATLSEVTCSGNANVICTVKATMDGTTFYSAPTSVKC
jgi:PKD repeat protein